MLKFIGPKNESLDLLAEEIELGAAACAVALKRQRNLRETLSKEHREAVAAYEALPFFKRLRTEKPEMDYFIVRKNIMAIDRFEKLVAFAQFALDVISREGPNVEITFSSNETQMLMSIIGQHKLDVELAR